MTAKHHQANQTLMCMKLQKCGPDQIMVPFREDNLRVKINRQAHKQISTHTVTHTVTHTQRHTHTVTHTDTHRYTHSYIHSYTHTEPSERNKTVNLIFCTGSSCSNPVRTTAVVPQHGRTITPERTIWHQSTVLWYVINKHSHTEHTMPLCITGLISTVAGLQ